jgi:rhodanese-related sulfurtransferase
MTRFFREAALLLFLAVVCAAVSNALAGPERRLRWASARVPAARVAGPLRPALTPPAPAASSPAAAADSFPPHPDKPWVDISGEQAALLHGRGVPFLDARRTSVFREGHVAGARAFSVWEADIDDKLKTFFSEGLDPSAPIVVYCSGGDCEDSHMLAQKLFMIGFDNVVVYKDGFPDWQRRGLPVRTGETP